LKFADRWKSASTFTSGGWFDARMRGISFRQVWIEPLAQRCCCDLNEFISTGTSAGETTSGRNTKRQPRSCAR
jgi:hypothetical protein